MEQTVAKSQTMAHNGSMDTTTPTRAITVNAGTDREATQVVRPLKENAKSGKTLVAFIQGARIATKWIRTDRIRVI